MTGRIAAILLSGVSCFLVSCASTADKGGAPDVVYQADFSEGKWNKADFLNVKVPRFTLRNDFFQCDKYITNEPPAENGKKTRHKSGHDYTSMLLDRKIVGGSSISSRLSFGKRMAPLIVLSGAPGVGKDGLPEFREHLEIVLFDQGINIWNHSYKDGKQIWFKAAYIKMPFQPSVIYDLEVSVKFAPDGLCQLAVSCDGTELLGCATTVLKPDQPYYAGITGYEGPCRFYDFKVVKAAGK